jgi:TolA-binding protein
MVNVNVPTNIIVQTIRDSGESFSADDIRCLTNEGAPAEVVSAAKATMSSGAPAETPDEDEAPAPGTNSRARSSSFENDEAIGGSSGSRELRDEGEEDAGRDPEKLEDCITAYNAKKFLTSSLLCFELYESKEYPDKETKILYYLSQSLYQLQMYHSAQYFYIEVLKKGTATPYFKYALPRLVTIARYTGDESDLMRIVAKIPPEEYPRSARNQLYYLLGLKNYQDGKLKEALGYFNEVSEKSELYTRSQYLEGIINNKQGKLKSAVRSFTAVAKAKGEAVTAQELSELDNIRDLSIMNIARIYYSIEQFENANLYYGTVPRNSRYWPQSLFESAWANFMLNDFNLTLGQLLTIQSPYYADNEFIPEAPILKALTFFQLCKYDDITRVLAEFDRAYRPVHEELKAFLQQYASEEGRKLSDQAFDRYFAKNAPDTALPKSLFVRLLRNQELAGLVAHLELMERERALIETQKTQWKDSVGTHLLKIMAEDEERLKARAGRAMLAEMATVTTYLGDLITQAEIIKFEVVDDNRERLNELAQGIELKSTGDTTVDYAVNPDKIFWPFNGEFWSDELGYYRFTEKTSCRP